MPLMGEATYVAGGRSAPLEDQNLNCPPILEDQNEAWRRRPYIQPPPLEEVISFAYDATSGPQLTTGAL